MIHAHAAGALHQRLHDHRRHFAGVALQRFFHVAEAAPRMVFPGLAGAAVEAVRRRHLDRLHQQRRVGIAVHAAAAHRQRAQGLAVVAVAERDVAGLLRLAQVAPVMGGHLQRHFHRRAAVVGVKAAVQALGGDGAELFRQPHHRLMGEAAEHDVIELVELFLQPRHDVRMAVAEDVGPPGTDRVEIALALEILEPHALCRFHRHQRQPLVVLHLGAGVPDVGEGAVLPVFVDGHGG